MSKAKEQHICLLEGQVLREAQVCVAYQTAMHIAHQITGITLTVGKHNPCFGVQQQHTHQFAARISGGTQYSYSYHGSAFCLGASNQRTM